MEDIQNLVLLFIGKEKSEFSQQKVKKKSGNFIDSHVWEPGLLSEGIFHLHIFGWIPQSSKFAIAS